MLPVFLLFLVLLSLNDLIFLDGFDEGVVVAGVVRQLALGQPDSVGGHTVQEILHSTNQSMGINTTASAENVRVWGKSSLAESRKTIIKEAKTQKR